MKSYYSHHIEISQLILTANQLTDFYKIFFLSSFNLGIIKTIEIMSQYLRL